MIGFVTSRAQMALYYVAQAFVIIGAAFPLYVLAVQNVERIRQSAIFFASCQAINWLLLIITVVIAVNNFNSNQSTYQTTDRNGTVVDRPLDGEMKQGVSSAITSMVIAEIIIGVLYTALIVNRLLAVHKYWVSRNLPSNMELNRVA